MMGRDEYEPFTLRPTKEMPYPTQQIHDELLKNKDKPLSTALVLPAIYPWFCDKIPQRTEL